MLNKSRHLGFKIQSCLGQKTKTKNTEVLMMFAEVPLCKTESMT